MKVLPLSLSVSAEAVSLIAFHGFTGGGLDFEPLAQGSDRLRWYAPEWSCLENVAKIICSIDEFLVQQNIKKAIFMGYSMGGRIALHYALARPQHVHKLILIGATPGIECAEERLARCQADNELADIALSDGASYFIDRWQQHPLIKTQKLRINKNIYEAMLQRRYALSPETLAHELRVFGTGVMQNYWPYLGDVSCPTMLITGEEDNKFRDIALRMCTLIKNAQHFEISFSGHAAHLENLDFSRSLIEQWSLV